jgi:rubrerythrin
MKSLKGSKTLENLMKAFAGESQARNRYTFYASVAAKEELRQIEAIFIETADNEKEHAKRFYKLMLQGLEGELPQVVHVDATYPVGQASTLINLKMAAAGEREEWTHLYSDFSSVAIKEGFPEVGAAFKMISNVEERHETRYNKLAASLSENTLFKKPKAAAWKCRNCGYVHEGSEAPDTCPACLHPKGYYELFVEAY